MSLPELCAIAVALSLDAFAAATGAGCAVGRPSPAQYARLAGAFGFFQFLMPLAGWHLGASVHGFIADWDHWIAFALLAWVGIAMARSGGVTAKEPVAAAPSSAGDPASLSPARQDPTQGSRLLILAVATSIDALAVGLSFSMLDIGIWGPAVLIGGVCAVLSALGLLLGARLARLPRYGGRAELVGGLALVAIGLRILSEHGVW